MRKYKRMQTGPKSFPELDTDQHTWWLGQLIRSAFFPDKTESEAVLLPPNAVRKWCAALQSEGHISAEDSARIIAINNTLDAGAEDLLKKSAEGRKIEAEDMDRVLDSMTELVSHTRALAQRFRVSDYTVDKITALRMEDDMRKDLAKEIERRSRKGAPFCLAIAAVNDLSSFQDGNRVLAALAGFFTRSFRSFDDIYILPDRSFAISLKQTDGPDACLVLERMRTQALDTGVALGPDGHETVKVSLSCGIAAADSQKGSVESLLAHARSAVAESAADGGQRVVLYEEVSPLMKFARQIDGD